MTAEPRVLLLQLSQRTSAKGTEYLTGWLGKAKVVAFAGKPDRYDNPTWDVFVQTPSEFRPARDAGAVPILDPDATGLVDDPADAF